MARANRCQIATRLLPAHHLHVQPSRIEASRNAAARADTLHQVIEAPDTGLEPADVEASNPRLMPREYHVQAMCRGQKDNMRLVSFVPTLVADETRLGCCAKAATAILA